MRTPQSRFERYRYTSTAYHEAGHTVAALLLGFRLVRVEVTSSSTGCTYLVSFGGKLGQLVEQADEQQRMSTELLRLWVDNFWISDSGAIAEVQFTLVDNTELAHGSMRDEFRKLAFVPEEGTFPFVEAYFYRNVGSSALLIKEACRAFFRTRHVSRLTQTVAEALLRTPCMDEQELLDTLLANRAALTGQMDLFWTPPAGDDPFVRRQRRSPPKQLSLF